MKKPTYMKILAFGCLLACSGGAVAQGYYEPIPYYGNDPFVFCTFGVPTDCWFPINPATGTFGVWNYYCFNPVSAAQYARVCPHAFVPVGQVKSPRREIDKERKSARSGIS
ncbi:hypothetical protein [Dyella ginsengisoli]|uniref:hypothetical protein n=1 Tax=Dyella ginsengisoli TaxID=363848 RepID=UPI0012FE2546|nr:hypothetical protein [Dyella ginsengisoli]